MYTVRTILTLRGERVHTGSNGRDSFAKREGDNHHPRIFLGAAQADLHNEASSPYLRCHCGRGGGKKGNVVFSCKPLA